MIGKIHLRYEFKNEEDEKYWMKSALWQGRKRVIKPNLQIICSYSNSIFLIVNWKMNIFTTHMVTTILKIILTFLHSHHEWEGIGLTRKINFEIFTKYLSKVNRLNIYTNCKSLTWLCKPCVIFFKKVKRTYSHF